MRGPGGIHGSYFDASGGRASEGSADTNGPPRAVRHRLQEERASITHKFSIAGHEGYITVGLYSE